MSKTWEPIPWPKVDELDRTALREELRQTRIAHNKDIDNLIQAEQRIKQLEEALRFIRDDAEDPREMWEEARTALSSEAPEKEEGEDG